MGYGSIAELEGRTRSSGSRFCADRSEAKTLNPHVGYPACLLSRQIPSPVWVHLRKTSTPGLEPGHPLKDYSRFSKPLPYQLGLYRHERRRQDLNLHGLTACLFSRQGLHQLSDCGKARLQDSNLPILADDPGFQPGTLPTRSSPHVVLLTGFEPAKF